MIRHFIIAFIILLGTEAFNISAFSQQTTITEHLREYSVNNTAIRIYQDSRLDTIMMRHIYPTTTERVQGQMYVTGKGYRIQIFSGNNQRESKQEAYEMESQLKEVFPDMDTYVQFNSPFWKLRVGNFRTSEEAYATLRELKKSFPKWKEMIIVPEKVKFVIVRPYGM